MLHVIVKNARSVRSTAEPLALVLGECRSCGHAGGQQVSRLRRQPTLGRLPYRWARSQYFVTCCTCGRSHEISEATAGELYASSADAAEREAAAEQPVTVRRRDFVL